MFRPFNVLTSVHLAMLSTTEITFCTIQWLDDMVRVIVTVGDKVSNVCAKLVRLFIENWGKHKKTSVTITPLLLYIWVRHCLKRGSSANHFTVKYGLSFQINKILNIIICWVSCIRTKYSEGRWQITVTEMIQYYWNQMHKSLYSIQYSYNKSQNDALFLNFILVKNSACFGQIFCPSSGVLILYSLELLFFILVVLIVWWQTVSITSMTNTNCSKYSIRTPDEGQKICPKHAEFFTEIKLRNSASCWLLL